MPRYMYFRFSAAILDLQLNGTVWKVADTTIKKYGPENLGVAAGISFLSALELEISPGNTVIMVLVGHLGFWVSELCHHCVTIS